MRVEEHVMFLETPTTDRAGELERTPFVRRKSTNQAISNSKHFCEEEVEGEKCVLNYFPFLFLSDVIFFCFL